MALAFNQLPLCPLCQVMLNLKRRVMRRLALWILSNSDKKDPLARSPVVALYITELNQLVSIFWPFTDRPRLAHHQHVSRSPPSPPLSVREDCLAIGGTHPS